MVWEGSNQVWRRRSVSLVIGWMIDAFSKFTRITHRHRASLISYRGRDGQDSDVCDRFVPLIAPTSAQLLTALVSMWTRTAGPDREVVWRQVSIQVLVFCMLIPSSGIQPTAHGTVPLRPNCFKHRHSIDLNQKRGLSAFYLYLLTPTLHTL